MKRCNDTLLKDTMVQILYWLEDYINQKIWWKEDVFVVQFKRSKHNQSPNNKLNMLMK
jgi:hypothetical protein